MSSTTTSAESKREIEFELNGTERSISVQPNTTLVELLREDLGETGTTQGCGVGVCGSCTVLVDGDMVSSCLELAVNVDGTELWTVEGLEDRHPGEGMHPLQEAFQDYEGFQCGYCTPGMLMTALSLLEENPDPSREDIKTHLSENICRCTGYEPIIEAIQAAAEYEN
jgi:carbon-monoxide dehydrogenase small subunit